MSLSLRTSLAGLLTLFIWLSSALAAPCQGFTIFTNSFPPIKEVKDGLISGIAGDALIAIMQRAGLEFDPRAEILPFKDAYDKTLTTPNSICLSLAKTPEREAEFKWVGPVYTSRVNFFAAKARNMTIRSIDDVMRYKIGVVRGTAVVHKLLELGVPEENFVYHATSKAMTRGLANGESDLIAYPKSPTFYLLAENGISPKDYEPLYEFMVVDLFIALNKNIDDATVARLQQELDNLKKPGPDGLSEYDHIIHSYFTPGI